MILVTGGAGFVGSEVVRQLAAAGHRVRLMVRHPRHSVVPEGCEAVRGDVLDPASVAVALRGVQAVIHLVGIIKETSAVTFERAHVEATKNLIEAAQRTGVRRFVQMSALGTRADAVSRYHRTKWNAEELVRASGLDWTIFRPSIIYGPRDKSLNLLNRFLQAPFDFLNLYSFPLFGGGTSRVQPVFVGDVARAFVRAVSNSTALGKTYDLCGPRAMTWRELWEIMAARRNLDVVMDDSSCLFLARSLIWAGAMALPLGMAGAAWIGCRSALGFVSAATAEAALLIVAAGWRQFLFYPVPWSYPRAVAALVRRVLPRTLHFHDQLAMMAEDNVGNGATAERDLHFTFGEFERLWRYPWT